MHQHQQESLNVSHSYRNGTSEGFCLLGCGKVGTNQQFEENNQLETGQMWKTGMDVGTGFWER